MTYRITEDCTSCSACASACPVNAISEGDNIYVINPDICTDCGECVETCPMEAILKS